MPELHAVPLCFTCATSGHLNVATQASVRFDGGERRWIQRFFCTDHAPALDQSSLRP